MLRTTFTSCGAAPGRLRESSSRARAAFPATGCRSAVAGARRGPPAPCRARRLPPTARRAPPPRRVPVRCRAPLPGANAGKGAFDKSIPGVDAPSVKRTCERMTARPAFRTLRLGYFFCMLSAVSVSCAKGNNAIGKENRGRGMGAVVSSGGRHGLEGRWRSSLRDGGRNYGSISYSCNTEASVIS